MFLYRIQGELMHFLIDADLPRSTAALVISYGHTAHDVRDLGMRHAKDPDIAAYAQREGLCLVSADWGFSDIRHFPPDQYHGIVVLGLPPHATGAQTLDVLRLLLEQPDVIEHLPRRLAIVEPSRIRLRPPIDP
jgi:predicted nuclease of predicted toxin-antitoxin system